MKESVKLEWLGLELGEGASLVDFARKFRELFGERIGEKAACLKLYRQYANIAERSLRGPYSTVAEAQKKLYSMECQIPPEELEEFQRNWDLDAPRRCYENNCEMPADAPPGQLFCSAEHAMVGQKILCGAVVERPW